MLYKSNGEKVRVALAHDHLIQKGGAEWVLKVFAEMFPDAPIFTTVYEEDTIGDWFPKERVFTSYMQHIPGSTRHVRLFLPFIKSAVESFDMRGYDLILSSVSGLIKGLITPHESVHVSYCHTPPRYLWSDTHEYFERLSVPEIVKKIGFLYATRLRTWDYNAAQRVDEYIANSKAVQRRIKKYYQRDSHVLYPPVEIPKFEHSVKPKEYYVIVSRLEPYKNIDLAIRAFNKLRIPFKIIGAGSDYKRLSNMANSNIEFLGYVSAEERNKIIANAAGCIHPHPFEDFGVALVESLALGTPVIAHASGGPLESMIPGVTGEFFHDLTWEDIADAVIRFDRRIYDRKYMHEHARRFSRERFVTELYHCLDEIMQKHETDRNL